MTVASAAWKWSSHRQRIKYKERILKKSFYLTGYFCVFLSTFRGCCRFNIVIMLMKYHKMSVNYHLSGVDMWSWPSEPQLLILLVKFDFHYNEHETGHNSGNFHNNRLFSVTESLNSLKPLNRARQREREKKTMFFDEYHFEVVSFKMQLRDAKKRKRRKNQLLTHINTHPTRKWRVKRLVFNEKNMQWMNIPSVEKQQQHNPKKNPKRKSFRI